MMADNDQDRRWLAVGEALFQAAGAADAPAVPGGRLYQFGVDPAFVTPCVLAFDDRVDGVDASLAIVGTTGIEHADVAAVPAADVPVVRGWSASLIGRAAADRHEDWRGTASFASSVSRPTSG